MSAQQPKNPLAEERIRGTFVLSILGHAALILLIIFGGRLFPSLLLGGQRPGDAGEGTLQANLVNAVPGGAIPMPSAVATITQNRLASDNPGPVRTQPRARPKPPPNAVELPSRLHPPKDLAQEQAARELKELAQADIEKAQTRVGSATGTPPSFNFSTTQGVGGNGGMAFGDAAFGNLYAEYVNHLRDRLTYYWSRQFRDPSIPAGRLVYVQFTVGRSGDISNIQFAERSGVPALDAMALHCVQVMATSEKLPLPTSYPRLSLDVRVSFELQ